MCLGLQSSFLYLCNCFSSQQQPHLLGNLKTQPCVGSTPSFGLCLIFTVSGQNRSSCSSSWSIFISHSWMSGIGRFSGATTLFSPHRLGEQSAIREPTQPLWLCWIKTISLSLQLHCCRTVFSGTSHFLQHFTFKLQSGQILRCFL